MNNAINLLINAARSGGNVNAMLNQMAVQNPQIRQAMQMMQGKTPQQIQQLAQNMAKERGTTVEDVARSLGFNIPR